PDLAGREQILRVHSKNKPLAKDVDVTQLAKRTAGMSGADLANVLNEAALLTARIGGNVITADALEEATDRVVGGPRRQSKVISEQEKKITAYHEGGHTLSAWALKDIERVYKVTILARGRTGGHAMTAQEDDKGMYTRDELFARLIFAMGGRAAEELVFGTPTTGASSDIEQATKIARAMITEYGFSPELGTVKYGKEQGDPMSYTGGGGVSEYSDAVAAKIDDQISYLLDAAHQQSYDILAEHRDYLDSLAEALLEKETLRRPDLEELFEGIEPREFHEVFPGENVRFPAQAGREPVQTPVELAIERGEEPPRRFTLLNASRQASDRSLAMEESAANAANGSDADTESSQASSDEPEIGFNFGQHAGDWTEEDSADDQPKSEKPSFAMSEPNGHKSAEPKPSFAMSEPKDSDSKADRHEASKPEASKPLVESQAADDQPEADQSADAEKKSERRPSEDDTAEIPIGRHHKPPMNDDEGWQAPGWEKKDDSRNPYSQPQKDNKDRHPGEDNY